MKYIRYSDKYFIAALNSVSDQRMDIANHKNNVNPTSKGIGVNIARTFRRKSGILKMNANVEKVAEKPVGNKHENITNENNKKLTKNNLSQ